MGWRPGHVQVGVVAADAHRLLEFYGEVLGLPFEQSLPIHEGLVLHFFAVGDARLKVAEVTPVPPALAPPGGVEAATGIRWITLECDDLDAVVARCESAGVRVVMPPRQAPTDAGTRFTMIEDPEGNWIEIVQRSG
jgi:predicted enzyme related to lactoylglutathione lyase